MRKKIALSLFTTLLLLIVLVPLETTYTYAAVNAKQIINAIGIMNTDAGSNNDGTAIVSRARFAQMLINASSLKDSVSNESNLSLFSDVKKKYWAAGYIDTVVSKGWMTGYLSGKFKPTQGVTLQESVYAIVQLLGYTNSDFSGNLSSGIMKLYSAKYLNKNISKTKNQKLTVNDCYNLFYNTLTASMKDGKVYAASLGYTVDSNGELDYMSLVSSSMEGPIIVDDNWKSELPFSTDQAVFYKDGEKCSLSDISDYDVLYYSKSLKYVWVYDNKVTGTVESINPDYTSPVSVTVSGKEYNFADSDASMKFSSMGEVKEGDIVTLVLDKNDKVVDALSIDEYNTTITGVVLSTGTHLVEDSSGKYENTAYITFVDASGNEYQEDYDSEQYYFNQGNIAKLTFTDGKAEISEIYSTSSNTDMAFNSDGSKLGSYPLASNVKILDINGSKYINVFSERLAGVTLSKSSIIYYELNSNNEISKLIINNVTNDMDKFGVMTGVSVTALKSSYTYMIGSESGSLSTDNSISMSTLEGPAGFTYSDNAIKSVYALTKIPVSSIGKTTIISDNVKYPLADNYSVYLLVDGKYIVTTIDKVSDLTKYSVSAYYDKPASIGGRIRVVVAQSK